MRILKRVDPRFPCIVSDQAEETVRAHRRKKSAGTQMAPHEDKTGPVDEDKTGPAHNMKRSASMKSSAEKSLIHSALDDCDPSTDHNPLGGDAQTPGSKGRKPRRDQMTARETDQAIREDSLTSGRSMTSSLTLEEEPFH